MSSEDLEELKRYRKEKEEEKKNKEKEEMMAGITKNISSVFQKMMEVQAAQLAAIAQSSAAKLSPKKRKGGGGGGERYRYEREISRGKVGS